ncbi:unnamed protein product [Hapterophycus canaliculatus]
MRGGEQVEGAQGKPTTAVDRREPGTSNHHKSAGLQQIQGVVENLSDLRRRKRAKQTTGVEGEPLVDNSTRSQSNESGNGGRAAGGGEWDTSRLDEDKLAGKIGSSKAARMLGLTEDQVRQAVLDAKEELKQSHSRSGESTGGNTSDDGMGFSGLVSTVVLLAGFGGLWVYLSAHPYGNLSRFLVGVFPREMETLGLAT